MNPYRYKISLRLQHPSLDPAEITSALGLDPTRSVKAGDPRTTPKGEPLEGTYLDSYWSARVAESDRPGKELRIAVDNVLDRLTPHRNYLHRIRSEGGNVEFFIGWFIDFNGGEVFDCDLLARMADLKINLSLDVYAGDTHLPP